VGSGRGVQWASTSVGGVEEPRRPYDALRRRALSALAPLVCLLLLPFLLLEIGPAYQARFGNGPTGTFTAQQQQCDSGGSCTWSGEFRSLDGTVRREGVRLIGGSALERAGDSVAAVDTGSEGVVYPADGGSNWLIITVLLAVVTAVLALTAARLLRRRPAER